MTTEKELIVNVLDVDDTIVARQWLARLIQYLRVSTVGGAKLNELLKKYESETDIPSLSEGKASDKQLSILERLISFNPHSTRAIMPGVLGILEVSKRCGIPNVVATGRAKQVEWIEMTKKSLKANGVDAFFEGRFFKPKDMDSALSKAIVIKHLLLAYENITFYEDDVETAIFITKIFRDKVKVRLIRHKMNESLYRKLKISTYENIQLFDLNIAEKKYSDWLQSERESK